MGQFIESEPMFLMYVSFWSAVTSAFLFALASYIGMRANNEETEMGESHGQQQDFDHGFVD